MVKIKDLIGKVTKAIQYDKENRINVTSILNLEFDPEIHYSIENKNVVGNFSINGHRFWNLNQDQIIEIVSDIDDYMGEMNVIRGKKQQLKMIVFVDNLYAFYNIFKDYLNVKKVVGGPTYSDMMNFSTETIEFRDLMILGGSPDPTEFYSGAENEENNLIIYENFIKKTLERGTTLNKINFSNAYVTTQIFKAENKELYKEMNSLIQPLIPYNLQLWSQLRIRTKACATIWTNGIPNFTFENVYYYDRSSFYPYFFAVLEQPLEEFKEVPCASEDILANYVKRGVAIEAKVKVINAVQKDQYQIPGIYLLERSKRIGRNTICIDEFDYIYLNKFYEYDRIEIETLFVAQKGKLPESYRSYLIETYRKKEELERGCPEQLNCKNGLNSQIGKAVQQSIYIDSLVIDEGKITQKKLSDEDFNKAFKRYNLKENFKHRYLVPQWGTRVYSAARLSIAMTCEKLINVGCEILYIDTDSIKFCCYGNIEDAKDIIEKDNEIARKKTNSDLRLGCWKLEAIYSKFRYFGAKRCIGEKEDGTREYVCAGADKKAVANYFNGRDLDSICDFNFEVPKEFKPKKQVTYGDKEFYYEYCSYSMTNEDFLIKLGNYRVKAYR